MDVFLPDAVYALRLIAFHYLLIYEARTLTEPFYFAVRSGGPQSLLVRVNYHTPTLLLGLRFLYSREHIQDILHSLTMFTICWNIMSWGTRCGEALRWKSSTLRNVVIYFRLCVSCQNTLIHVAGVETSVFIHKISDVFSPTCLILTDVWTCFNGVCFFLGGGSTAEFLVK